MLALTAIRRATEEENIMVISRVLCDYDVSCCYQIVVCCCCFVFSVVLKAGPSDYL